MSEEDNTGNKAKTNTGNKAKVKVYLKRGYAVEDGRTVKPEFDDKNRPTVSVSVPKDEANAMIDAGVAVMRAE